MRCVNHPLFLFALILLSAALQACSNNSTPQISALTDIYEISLSASVINYSTLSSVVVSGNCGTGVTEIDDSLDGGGTWQNVSVNSTSYNLNCEKNQTFSATFNFSTNTPAAWSGTPSGSYHVLFRSKSYAGNNASLNLVLAPTSLNLSTTSVAAVHSSGSQISSVFKVTVSGASQHGSSVDAQLRVQ